MSHSDSIAPLPGQREFEAGKYDRALPLLLPVAQDGHAEAQCMIGCIYQLGLGSAAPDFHEAIAWYRRAAALGYGVASNNLAGMYLSGSGVPVDRDRARQLYEQARSQGFIGGIIDD
ncbi:sel1 repeat family protein [Microcoleus sp. FACHB-1515]|uniref:tetratricopeptide repeat protein n=1 Tax=Cyanophyceae TaxID=3028117 RepID=UPI001683BF84|nr:tetratricopeptide repeat protein [Microcoleus sp. FACHB-1515]MBD2088323.1 sel1 repeat family protein [Microcoleus sp. FACHB-1515]